MKTEESMPSKATETEKLNNGWELHTSNANTRSREQNREFSLWQK